MRIGRGLGILVMLAALVITGCAKATVTQAPSKVVAQPVESTPAPEPTETTFSDAHDFFGDIAWVQRELDGPWEAIDGTGKTIFVLSAGETPLTDFVGGSAMVSYPVSRVDPTGGPNLEKAVKLVDRQGSGIFPKSGDTQLYESNGSLINGYHIVEAEISTPEAHETQRGLIDNTGKWIVEPLANFDMKGTNFGHEYAPAIGFTEMDYRYNIPNPEPKSEVKYFNANTGEAFAMPILDRVWSKIDDKKLSEKMVPYIFHDGRVLMRIDVRTVSAYGRDFAPVGFKRELPHDKNGNWDGGVAYYGEDRKVAFDLSKYPDVYPAGDFRDGYLSIVLSNGSQRFYVILDKSGKQMFEPIKGYSIQQFAKDRALVDPTPENDHNNGCFYIDLNGVPAIHGIQLGNPFAENGLARVRLDGADDGTDVGWQFITTDGDIAF